MSVAVSRHLPPATLSQWEGFEPGFWQQEINVRDFIQRNYKQYEGDGSFMAPAQRAIMPNGGFRMVVNALKTYGYEPDSQVAETFTKHRKTHNDAVFDAYTGDQGLPQFPHFDGTSGCLRSWPHHRRLPPSRALRSVTTDWG